MFDHVSIGTSNLAESRGFFSAALAPLGIGVLKDFGNAVGFGSGGKASFWLGQAEQAPTPLHLAFTAHSREQVEAFHRAAMAAGGKDNGGPGLRPQYSADYYAAFVIGPDGHNVEAVTRAPA